MGRVACYAFACVLAGCYTSPAPQPPPPPPSEIPGWGPAARTEGFAPPPAGGPRQGTLPTTGPECQTGCPTTAPRYPTEHCRDGTHIGGRGPCVRFANG